VRTTNLDPALRAKLEREVSFDTFAGKCPPPNEDLAALMIPLCLIRVSVMGFDMLSNVCYELITI